METLFKSNSAIIEAAANGALTPEQAYTMTSLLKTQGEFIVARDLVERLRAIEEVANLRKEAKRV
jgi:hypothetical protein